MTRKMGVELVPGTPTQHNAAIRRWTPGIGSNYFPGSSGMWGRPKGTPAIGSTYFPGSSGQRGRPKRTPGIGSTYFPGSSGRWGRQDWSPGAEAISRRREDRNICGDSILMLFWSGEKGVKAQGVVTTRKNSDIAGSSTTTLDATLN